MILLIDNYDSFTWNVYQMIAGRGREVVVVRNDEITVDEVAAMDPTLIIISPGPGTPDHAGICVDVIRRLGVKGSIPVFGVCLGMQCIGAAFGGSIVRAGELVHGKVSDIQHEGRGVFSSVPAPTRVVRYHSLVVDADTLPDEIEITARAANGLIMGLRHRSLPIEGVQFHPESILTRDGAQIIDNAMQMRGTA